MLLVKFHLLDQKFSFFVFMGQMSRLNLPGYWCQTMSQELVNQALRNVNQTNFRHKSLVFRKFTSSSGSRLPTGINNLA